MKLLPDNISKLPIAFFLSSSMSLLGASASAQVIQKPGAIQQGSEFGTVLDRFESYTLVGADTEGDKSAGDYLGTVRLFEDSSTGALRTYQFSPDPAFPRELANKMNLGIAVSMSDTWIAMGIGRWAYTMQAPFYKTAVALVRKNSGSFPSCPTSGGVTDCRGFIQPMFFDDDPVVRDFVANRGKFNLAVSNKHLVVGFANARNSSNGSGDKYGYAKLFTYDSSRKVWDTTATVSNLNLEVGAAVAADDQKAVIAAPVVKGYLENSLSSSARVQGRVISMHWNSSTKTWTRKVISNTQNLPYFANTLAMSGDTLVVASGFPGHKSESNQTYATGYLSFYRLINNEWVLEETVQTERAAVRVAVHQNMAVISLPGSGLSGTDSPIQAFQGVENVNQGGILRDWQSFGGVRRTALKEWGGGSIWGPDGLDISREKIAFGWRGASKYNSSTGANVPNVGLIAREDFGRLYEASSQFTPASASTSTTARVFGDSVARLGGFYSALSTQYGGFNGSGYASLLGGLIEWTVNVPASSTYKICMRYANGLSNASLYADLVTSGSSNATELAAPPTGSWSSWGNACVSKYLPVGINTIRLEASSKGSPNIDSISVGK